jgi:mono/diheme cytochrome c family protein
MLTAAVALALSGSAATADDARLARGEYLSRIMDCAGCHTRGAFLGKPDPDLVMAGSEVGFYLPGLGIFWPPNLTSDTATGLGDWTEAEIAAAVTKGVRPDGRMLSPAMPVHAYSALTDDDALALAAYIKTLPPKPFADEPQPVADPSQAKAPYMTVVFP